MSYRTSLPFFFNSARSFGERASKTLKCELDFSCKGIKSCFSKPIVKGVCICFIVHGIVASILIVFCAIQYNVPGDAFIEFNTTNTSPNTHSNTTKTINDDIALTTLPPTSISTTSLAPTSAPTVTVSCPCFELDTVVDVVKRPTTKIDEVRSCNKLQNRQAIYFKEITGAGGFQINNSIQGFIVNISGERDQCSTIGKGGTHTLPILEEEGHSCLSLLEKACKVVEDRLDKVEQSKEEGRQFQETYECSCFTADDLTTRPNNQYILDEKKSCKTDHPLIREMFFTSGILGSLRRGTYGFSVIVDDDKATCIGKDGKAVSVPHDVGRSCFNLMDNVCSKKPL